MAKEEYILDGFLFENRQQYDRAKKEKETIAYLTANTDSSDMTALLKVYNRSVEKGSFRTIIGQQYLYNLKRRLEGSGIVDKDTLSPIKVSQTVPGEKKNTSGQTKGTGNQQAARYKALYENEVANRKVKNIIIFFLILIIAGMIAITVTSRYTVYTYFTDYKTKIRNEVEDELEDWQNDLEQREQELNRQ
jgi:hypothetical protein